MDQVPETIKTGLLSEPGDETQLDATKQRLLATVTVMTEKAGIMAYQYAIHDSRTQEDHHDVCMGLKYQARTFLQTVDRPDIVKEILEMEALMYGEHSGSSGESEEDSDDDPEEFEDTAASEFKQDFIATRKLDAVTNKCVCDDCKNMRDAVDTWDDWAPEDEAEIYLKERVTSAVSIFD